MSQTFRVVIPKDGKPDILGVVTEDHDEAAYVRQLESYYGFPCVVRVMSFTPPATAFAGATEALEEKR